MFLGDSIGTNNLIFNINDTTMSDSLSFVGQANQISYQDSVWNALQNSLFHDPMSGKDEASHFFTQNTLVPFENLPYVSIGFDWFFVISLFFLLCLVFIRFHSSKVFTTSYSMLVKGKNSENRYSNMPENVNALQPVYTLCLWMGLSLIVYCSSFYLSSDCFSVKIIDSRLLIYSFGATAVFIVLQFLLLKIVSFLFNARAVEIEYRKLRSKLYFVLSVLVFPFVFLFVYYHSFSSFGQTYPMVFPILLGCILLICIVLLFHQLGQGWGVFRKRFRLHEYFLYLCTIEILPLLLFLKLAINLL